MGRAADEDVLPHDLARDGKRKVVLAEMQDRRACSPCDVGTIVHGEQRAMPLCRFREHLEQPQLVARLEPLLAQLHDVDPAGEDHIEKLRKVARPRARVGTEIEPGVSEHRPSVGLVPHGSSPQGGLRGQQPTVEPDPGNSGVRERMTEQHSDIAIIGAGTIGAAVAWRCAQRGLTVTLADPDSTRGAWHTAAGMLAPITELHYTEEPLLRLGLASLERFPAFAAELEDDTGLPVGLEARGTVAVAWDSADLAGLQDLAAFARQLGVDVELLTGRELRTLEPALAAGMPGALHAPGEQQVDPRLLHAALLEACRRSGVTIVRSAASVFVEDDRATGLTVADARHLADHVVLTAGAWSAQIEGVPPALLPPVRPVKGQTLRLRLTGAPRLSRVVRAEIKGSHVYLVPRSGGQIVVGASTEEAGYDTAPRAGAVYELLRDAQTVLPELSEAVLDEVSTGLRPGTPDNAPIIGTSALDGLIIASGHYRNGILLTPITADAIAEYVTTGEVPDVVTPFSPARFAGARAVRT